MGFTEQDKSLLQENGIALSWARTQLDLLRHASPNLELLRPATPGDGIVELNENEIKRYAAEYHKRSATIKVSKFVPASGAATRMFSSLHPNAMEQHENECLYKRLKDLPFASLLPEHITKEDLPAFILEESGLGYRNRPKALIPFFNEADGLKTPLDIHIREAISYANATVHFTIADQWQKEIRAKLSRYTDVNHSFSTQNKNTDLLAVDQNGDLLRNEDGSLLLRPGGHGALLENLSSLDASLVFVKNIDNVQNGALAEESALWRAAMAGLLLEWADKHSYDKPVRVCAMVPNSGEPGGGPFWVSAADGEQLQIVESVETDSSNAISKGTHFNPVDMVCLIRNKDMRPFELKKYRDDKRFIVATKTVGGQKAKILEWPGLWNGAMAEWHTIFVAMPPRFFTPVKTVMDLLRD